MALLQKTRLTVERALRIFSRIFDERFQVAILSVLVNRLGILIYDQPSQVYFPKRSAPSVFEEEKEIDWRDEDIVAVRKIFKLFSDETIAMEDRLQIVVLDHADDGVWGGIGNLHLVDEWRGDRALVPKSWISASGE